MSGIDDETAYWASVYASETDTSRSDRAAAEPASPRRVIPALLGRKDLATLPDPEPLIENTLDLRTISAVAGPPGSLKSFVLISWLCSIATGRPWLGRPVNRGPVLLVAGEGAYGIHHRIAAWEQAHGITIDNDALTVIAGPVNLMVNAELRELCAEAGGRRLVALDTLARCTTGAEENSARDMGIAVEALYRIRDAAGDGSVTLAHHTPKGDGKTMRGSTALPGGLDTIYMADGDAELVRLTRTKRKDGPEHDEITGCLRLATPSGRRLERSGYFADKITSVSGRSDELVRVFMDNFSATGASRTQLREVADMAPATFHRSLNALVNLGILVNLGSDERPFYRLATKPGEGRGDS